MKFYEIIQQIVNLNKKAKKVFSPKIIGNLGEKEEGSKKEKENFNNDFEELYKEILKDLAETRSSEVVEQAKELLGQIKNNLEYVYEAKEEDNVSTVLLPITKLAYLYESNGIPEEHAEKLGLIFANIDDALDYLNRFAKDLVELERQRNIRKGGYTSDLSLGDLKVVYDACMFSLPEKPFDFKHKTWQKIIKANILNPECKSLLAIAPEL